MATRRSKTRLDVLRGTPPGELTALDLDLVIAEADRKIALMQALAESDAWRLLCRVREQRKKNLGRQLEGLVKRLAQPLEGQPPATTDQLTYLRGRQDENTELLSFPARARLLWQQEREQLDQFRQQRASSLHAPPRR